MATTSEVSANSPVKQASAGFPGVDLSEKAAPSIEGSPRPVTTEMSPEDLNSAPTTGVLATEEATPSAKGSFSVSPQPNSTEVCAAYQDSRPASGVFSSGLETPSMTVSPQPVSTGNQPENQGFPPAAAAFFSPAMAIQSTTVPPQPVSSGVSPENQDSKPAIGVLSPGSDTPRVTVSPQPLSTRNQPENQDFQPEATALLSTTMAIPSATVTPQPEASSVISSPIAAISTTALPQPDSTMVVPAYQDSTQANRVLSSEIETPSMTVSPRPVSTGNQHENQDVPPATTALFSSAMAIPSATVTPQLAASGAISSAIATPSATVSPPPVATAVSPENQGSAPAIGVSSGMPAPSLPNSNPAKKRGRPMGSRNKPKKPKQNGVPQDLGNLVASSGGLCFTPHIFMVPAGEDIMGKIIALSQQGIRGISVLSATGLISTATLRRTSPYTKITYEGQFEIVALTGSLTPTNPESDDGSRLGCLTIQFAGPDAEVVGGLVGGQLIAASPVQVVVASYSEDEQNPEREQASFRPNEVYYDRAN